ncbi:MAG TPA: hypothetical protein VNH83_30265 [Bryobacteraceae bacterium]|nr:hypothetical protein [Bryobacteraceae bacterium]
MSTLRKARRALRPVMMAARAGARRTALLVRALRGTLRVGEEDSDRGEDNEQGYQPHHLSTN